VMDALQRVNRHFGITVLCNIHSVDLARAYCDRLIGMAHGRIVFDGPIAAFTPDAARDLYGLDAEADGRMAPRAEAAPEAALALAG
jgi:phosphonate transport system ATP-binding protein